MFALSVLTAFGDPASQVSLRLSNPPSTGKVTIVFYDSASAFADTRQPILVMQYAATTAGVYRVENLTPGEYAFIVYHDENDNGRVDRNFIGIPIEPIGFSNDYRPKGPPSYSRAAFRLAPGENRIFDIGLRRPLGELGRIGLGVGVIGRSSPYRDSDAGVYQLIPALTYIGERVQIYGPFIQIGILGSGDIRLAATGQYRIGVYEEDESEFLEGMGDRKNTFMAGLAVQSELPAGFDLSIGYQLDVLDEIGGGQGKMELDKGFQFGVLTLSPKAGLNWFSAEVADHDFGVPMGKATEQRPQYEPGETLSYEAGFGATVEISSDWLFVSNFAVELLDGNITDSPIVADDYVFGGFMAVSYLF